MHFVATIHQIIVTKEACGLFPASFLMLKRLPDHAYLHIIPEMSVDIKSFADIQGFFSAHATDADGAGPVFPQHCRMKFSQNHHIDL